MRNPLQQYGDHPPSASEITPREMFESRRDFIRHLAVGSIASASLLEMAQREVFAQNAGTKLAAVSNAAYVSQDKKTAYKDATTYNNFYEFGFCFGGKPDENQLCRHRQTKLKKYGVPL